MGVFRRPVDCLRLNQQRLPLQDDSDHNVTRLVCHEMSEDAKGGKRLAAIPDDELDSSSCSARSPPRRTTESMEGKGHGARLRFLVSRLPG